MVHDNVDKIKMQLTFEIFFTPFIYTVLFY